MTPIWIFACCIAMISTSATAAPAFAADAAGLRIEEIRLDQPGPDCDEFFELAGTPGTSLDGLFYVVLGEDDMYPERGCGIVEECVDLDGLRLDATGLLCVAEPLARCAVPTRRQLNFENNDSVTHLLVRGIRFARGDDLDRNDDGVIDGTPWLELLDAVAISEGRPANCVGDEFVYAPQVLWPDGAFSPGHVRRCDGVWTLGEFEWPGNSTPGLANDCQAIAAADSVQWTRR